MANINDSLNELLTIDGSMAAAVVDSASVGRNPVSPRLWLNLTVAGLLGLLLGLALALVRDALDDTVKRREDLDALGLAGLFVRVDEVGEGPAGVDPDHAHGMAE